MDTSQHISVSVVEDEADLRDEVVAALLASGFRATGHDSARSLYLGLLAEPVDVVVLDLGLPDEDGFSVLANLRRTTDVGIVVMTARSLVADRIAALEEGADAYLIKPIDFAELAATLGSVSRRLRERRPPSAQEWRLSGDHWFLISPRGERVALSATDKTIAEILLDHPNTTVPREALVRALGYHPDEVLSNRLDMAVSRLRRKVFDQTGATLPLRVLRGVGFSLLADQREH